MDHTDVYLLRETYNQKGILLCFNGPFSQALIEEIGNALRNYMESEAASSSSTRDVFAAYIEIAQNIRQYAALKGYNEAEASATVVIGREGERYVIAAGNVVEPDDGLALIERVNRLASLDKGQLRAQYKERLRTPRDPDATTAGLGLIDIARKASAPLSCSLRPVNAGQRMFFSLRVVL